MVGDKTIKEYWDNMWGNDNTPESIKPHAPGINNHTARMFHEFFGQVFSSINTSQSKLLEIGCANSVWLPYFNKEFDFNVTGLDYSQIGCDKSKFNLNNENVEGSVVCADLFCPPSEMKGTYDVVVSFGVAEHFDDTSKCIKALSVFLKDGGILLTIIPNMAGSLGYLQKHLNRPVFDIHNPINKEDLIRAHNISDCEIIECDYFMSTSFGLCNLNGIRPYGIEGLTKKVILSALVRSSMLIWSIESIFGKFPAIRSFSPYICSVAKKH